METTAVGDGLTLTAEKFRTGELKAVCSNEGLTFYQ